MKKIQLVCLVSLLATGISHATPACNGFQITIKNNLKNAIVGTTIKLDGAKITPSLVEIDKVSEKSLTVTESVDEKPMSGELVFKTLNIPSETIHIKFKLENMLLVCGHTPVDIDNAYPVTNSRKSNNVVYTLG